MDRKKKGHQKSSSYMPSAAEPAAPKGGGQSIETTLHGYAMVGPFSPGPKDVWYCDHPQCRYTQHGLYRRYNIENWRSSKFGKKFVLCDGCVRLHRKQQIQHQQQASAPNVNVSLNINGGFQRQQPAPQPFYAQPMSMAQPVPMNQSQGQFQDHGHQQSAFEQQGQQMVPFSNAKIADIPPDGGYGAASDFKSNEGAVLNTGALTPITPPTASDDEQFAATPPEDDSALSTFNGLTLGHGVRIVQRGWMMKKGQMVKNWKRRYFVLKSDGVLNYYESDNSSMVKGRAELTEALRVDRKNKKSLDVVTPKRTWSFLCATTELRDEWAENIEIVAGIR